MIHNNMWLHKKHDYDMRSGAYTQTFAQTSVHVDHALYIIRVGQNPLYTVYIRYFW
jgi:hypothetical protein